MQFDANEDNRLEFSEFKQLCNAADFNLSDEESKKAIELLDKRGTGYVECASPSPCRVRLFMSKLIVWFPIAVMCARSGVLTWQAGGVTVLMMMSVASDSRVMRFCRAGLMSSACGGLTRISRWKQLRSALRNQQPRRLTASQPLIG